MSEGPVPRWVLPVLVAGAVGVIGYVSAWALAGVWTEGYDPVSQAISELFALDAPARPAWLVRAALIATGVVLVPFGWALHVTLPGTGLAGPLLAAVSGVATALVVVFPCTAGCPGIGASATDTWHTIVAGTGYAALVLAPVAFGVRMRGHDDRFAAISIAVGFIAGLGFAARAFGVGSELTGLSQRIFNTLADAWYVLAALYAAHHARSRRPATPTPADHAGDPYQG